MGHNKGSRTRCSACGLVMPVDSRLCVADGNSGLIHIECAKKLRAADVTPGPWDRACACGQSYVPLNPADGSCPACKEKQPT